MVVKRFNEMRLRILFPAACVSLILMHLGCTGVNDQDIPTIVISSDVACDRHPMDSLFEIDEYVILEETPESRISVISRLTVSSDEIIILDNKEKLVFFGMDGKFRYCLQKVGHARDEYISASDFDVRDDTLYVLDKMGRKIQVYQRDGTYVRSIGMEPARGIKVLDNGMAVNHEFGLADGTSQCYCYEYLGEGNGRKEIVHNPYLAGRAFTFPGADDGFYESKDGMICYLIPYDEHIYAIDRASGEVRPWVRMVIGEGGRTISADDSRKTVQDVLGSSVPSNVFSFYLLDELLVFSYYGTGDRRQYVFHDIREGTIHNGPLEFDKHRIPPMIVSYDTDEGGPKKLLCIVPSSFIKNSYDRLEDKESYPILGEISGNIAGQENPVLVFYKRKKHHGEIRSEGR